MIFLGIFPLPLRVDGDAVVAPGTPCAGAAGNRRGGRESLRARRPGGHTRPGSGGNGRLGLPLRAGGSGSQIPDRGVAGESFAGGKRHRGSRRAARAGGLLENRSGTRQGITGSHATARADRWRGFHSARGKFCGTPVAAWRKFCGDHGHFAGHRGCGHRRRGCRAGAPRAERGHEVEQLCDTNISRKSRGGQP